MATQSSSRRTVKSGRCVVLALTCLLLPQAQPHAFSATQAPESLQEDRPITKENLLLSLKAGGLDPRKRIPAARYIKLIRGHGVRFRITPVDERNIRKAGDYLSALDLDKMVAALRASYRPATFLSGRVEQVKVAANPGGGIQVFLQLKIRNDGAPTVARKYALKIMHATSASIDFNGAPLRLSEPFMVPEDEKSGEVLIRPEDDLALKTSRAISTGKSVTGWLRFFLPLLPDMKPEAQLKPEFLRQPGIWYVVSFVDAAGEPYEEAFEVN